MNKIVILMLGLMAGPAILSAKTDYRDNYNYKRAMEFWRDDDDKCMEWMLKEIEDCPKNGFAYYRLSALYRRQKEYGSALEAANKCIELLKKEKPWDGYSYNERAYVYLSLADSVAALKDLDMAVKLQPEEESILEDRGNLLYELHRYDEAARDFNAYIKLKPGNTFGYMALGRNAQDQGDQEEAIRQFTYCTKLSPSYGRAYAFRAESYVKQGKWREAIDDVITCLQNSNQDNKAFSMMETLADSSFQLLDIRMRAQYRKDPTNAYWPMLLADVYNRKERYADALKYNQVAFDITGHPSTAKQLALSHSMLGQYEESVKMMDRACELDSTDITLVLSRAQIKEEASMYEEAIVDYDRVIESHPDVAYGYEQKASCLVRMGKLDDAKEALEIALAHDSKSSHANLLMGRVLNEQGNKAEAEVYLLEAIELDKESSSLTNTQYAYLYLQRYDSLEAVQKRILEKNLNHNGNLYNVACTYALRGDTAQAMSYLKQSLDAGFISFRHARKDTDFGEMLQSPDFLNLLAEYEARFNESQGIIVEAPLTPEAKMEGDVSEIPFTKEGGVCKVKCAINDLPLYFIFDTGASDVTISTVEATFMFKNGYLSQKDITGRAQYMNANGEISEGTTIVLRSVTFGGVTLTNVKASVVASQNAPLLLGQSVLARLGSIQIDNQKKVIRIKK